MSARRSTLSEAAMQAHVVKLLQAYARPDIIWWHCPNGELRNHRVGAKLKLAGVRAGVADLNLVIDGRFHAVELKTEIGTLSGKQLEFQVDLERAGGFFHAAFGIDQAIGILSGIQAFRPGITFQSTAAFDGRGVRSRPWEKSPAGIAQHQSPREGRAPA
jgi:hypothetical protein